ncbi:aminopeptidase P family protein [uncultured Tyzzerella sp.]|uniref:aminopeptidase P family protein n=1 Tax=uncultured Tyzzerella sp. TaxID=2321398 RepID=UPI0029420137|nr:aminopeptidase P family protein [uncultured Tyzzerella sp.]
MQHFFKNNRKKIIGSLKEEKAIIFLFSGKAQHKTCDQFFPFEPNRNFYYMTGIDKPHLIYMAIKNGDNIDETLFIERYDEFKAKWNGKTINEEEATNISGIENIKYIDEFYQAISTSIFRNNIETVYLDLENRYLDKSNRAFKEAELLKENYPYINIKNIYNNIGYLRLFKEEQEIEYMKNAINITKKGIENILKNANPNIMEYELEACFDYEIKRNGSKDKAFNTILASGQNATVLHYEDNNDKINDCELVLIDLGATYKYYNADISRTFPINGKFTDRQKQLYNIVLEGQRKVIEAIKPGLPFKRLNEILLEHYQEELTKIGLIKDKSEVSKYYYHGVSHYLGLDTHDVSGGLGGDDTLKKGMVITVEPGLYIAEEKIGIRIEDDILVTETGYENLSKDIIKTVEEIENFFKNR